MKGGLPNRLVDEALKRERRLRRHLEKHGIKRVHRLPDDPRLVHMMREYVANVIAATERSSPTIHLLDPALFRDCVAAMIKSLINELPIEFAKECDKAFKRLKKYRELSEKRPIDIR